MSWYFSAYIQVKFSTVEEMNFSKHKLLQCCKQPSKKALSATKVNSLISVDNFYSSLAESNPQASILSIIPDHSKNFVPQSFSKSFLISISALYEPKYLNVPYVKLFKSARKHFIGLMLLLNINHGAAYKRSSKIKALVLSLCWKDNCFKVQSSCAYRCCSTFTVPN